MTFQTDKTAALAALNLVENSLNAAMTRLTNAYNLVEDLICEEQPPIYPPVFTGKAVSIGSAMHDVRLNWMADMIDLSKCPAPVPFNCYHDKAKGILAPSQKGVLATRYFRLPVWGVGGGLYAMIPVVNSDGTVTSWTGHAGDANYITDPQWAATSPKSVEGVRGKCMINPYTTWKGHPTLQPDPTNPGGALVPIPRAPLYIGARLDGAIMALYAGNATEPSSCQKLGQIKNAASVLDIALNPQNRAIFYTPDRKQDGSGRIVKIDRSPAIAARPPGGIEDGALWVQSDYCSLPGVTSVCVMDDGSMYAAAPGGIFKIVNGVATLLVKPLTTAFFLSYTSTQKLVMLDVQSGVYVFDPANPVLGTNLTPSQFHAGVSFGTVSVDRAGTWGPVDNIAFIRSHGPGNKDCFFYSGPGWNSCVNWGNVPVGQSTRAVGDTVYSGEPFGHYGWVAEYHPDQGIILCQGFSNYVPWVLVPARPSDPPREFWSNPLMNHGAAVFNAGTIKGHEGTKPSFSAQMCGDGHGPFTSFDYIAELPTVQAMVDYIHKGMEGSFRRDEIQGRDLLAILYLVVGGSQRLIREGQPFIDWVLSYFPSSVTTVETPPSGYPQFTPWSSSQVLCTAISDAGQIKIRFRDSGNNATTHSTQVVVKVTLDGSITAGIANQANGWTFPAPTVEAGQHSLDCLVTSTATPDHIGEAAVWIK